MHGKASLLRPIITEGQSSFNMSMFVSFKDKGIEFARNAVTEDEAGNYEKALQLYLASLE